MSLRLIGVITNLYIVPLIPRNLNRIEDFNVQLQITLMKIIYSQTTVLRSYKKHKCLRKDKIK